MSVQTYAVTPNAGAFPPYSASLDQVLVLLKRLALSPAFTTEIASYKAQLQGAYPQQTLLVDANGAIIPISFAPEDGENLAYIPDAFAQATSTPMQKILVPAPICEFVGMPGRVQIQPNGERFTNQIVEGEVYTVDSYTWVDGDDPNRNQLAAVAMSYCLKNLIRRNEQLGGIVQLIEAQGPVEPLAAAPPAKPGSTIMAARQRWQIYVLLP